MYIIPQNFVGAALRISRERAQFPRLHLAAARRRSSSGRSEFGELATSQHLSGRTKYHSRIGEAGANPDHPKVEHMRRTGRGQDRSDSRREPRGRTNRSACSLFTSYKLNVRDYRPIFPQHRLNIRKFFTICCTSARTPRTLLRPASAAIPQQENRRHTAPRALGGCQFLVARPGRQVRGTKDGRRPELRYDHASRLPQFPSNSWLIPCNRSARREPISVKSCPCWINGAGVR
jgi:hypothetical protein